MQRLGPTGNLIGNPVLVTGDVTGTEDTHTTDRPAGRPKLALAGERGQFVLVWNEAGKNFARVFQP